MTNLDIFQTPNTTKVAELVPCDTTQGLCFAQDTIIGIQLYPVPNLCAYIKYSWNIVTFMSFEHDKCNIMNIDKAKYSCCIQLAMFLLFQPFITNVVT